MPTSPPQFPLDIYVHILSQVPPSRSPHDDSGARTLANSLQANTVLREAASIASIWEPHYRLRYLHSIKDGEIRRKESNSGDWRLMYAERRRLDSRALELLEKIVRQRIDRYKYATTLTEMSFDVWDVLELESRCPVPGPFREEGFKDGVILPHALTRCYWARSVLEAISRSYAIDLWGKLITPGEIDLVSFEDAFSALSCFYAKPPSEVTAIFDELATSCREYLTDKLALRPEDQSYNVANVCSEICVFMRSRGFGPVEHARFRDILNHFPHAYLTTNKKTIPISLVHVFVAISRRLGIRSSPVNFPGRVLAHITSPAPEEDDFYVDVFDSATKTILSIREDVPRLLLSAGMPPQTITSYMAPCGGAPMLLRAARNLSSAIHVVLFTSRAESRAPIFASISIHLLLTSDVRLAAQLMSVIDFEPLDCATFISNLIPLLQPAGKTLLETACQRILQTEEENAPIIRRRPPSRNPVKYFVGMFFEHARYGYSGCIIGWEDTCGAAENWIIQMGVDDLARGRDQPFYSVLSSDGTQRYVAEDNISPINPHREMISALLENAPCLPMYLEDVEPHEVSGSPGRGRMLPSPDSRNAFPDDDHVGRLWVEKGELPV